jgi:hypothetical protein
VPKADKTRPDLNSFGFWVTGWEPASRPGKIKKTICIWRGECRGTSNVPSIWGQGLFTETLR